MQFNCGSAFRLAARPSRRQAQTLAAPQPGRLGAPACRTCARERAAGACPLDWQKARPKRGGATARLQAPDLFQPVARTLESGNRAPLISKACPPADPRPIWVPSRTSCCRPAQRFFARLRCWSINFGAPMPAAASLGPERLLVPVGLGASRQSVAPCFLAPDH